MNKAKAVREYKKAHPNAKPVDIGKACGVSTTYVYQVMYKDRNKKIKPSTPDSIQLEPTQGQQILRDEIERLNAEVANLQILDEINDEIIAGYVAEIEQLKNDNIGYRAVISYLQGQLNGLTV